MPAWGSNGGMAPVHWLNIDNNKLSGPLPQSLAR